MEVQGDGTPSLFDKNSPSSERFRVQVMNQVRSEPPNKQYKSGSSFMDSDTYCRVCYDSNHITSERHNLKQGTQIVMGRNRNYDAKLGEDGNHWRQMQ